MPFELYPEWRGSYPGDAHAINWRECRIDASALRPFQTVIEALYRQHKDRRHDICHITRGLVLASMLIKREELYLDLIETQTHAAARGGNPDRLVVNWSMVLHDVGTNEHDIPDHGDLGADIVTPWVRASPLFTPDQTEHIITNVRWHNKPHEQIPFEVRTYEFGIFTNADALDLVRMEDERTIILGPRTIGLRIGEVAQSLFEKTKNLPYGHEFDGVIDAADELGLLIA